MTNNKRTLITLFSVAVAFILMMSSQFVMAQGNSNGKGNGNGKGNSGKNQNIGVGNASDGIKGRVVTDKGIIYTGEPLEIGLQFARGAELIVDGEVDAFVVIFAPNVSDDDTSDDSDSSDSDDADSSDDSDSSGSDDADSSDDSDSSDGDDADSGDDSSDDSDSSGGSDEALTDAIVVPVGSAASEDETELFSIEAVDLSEISAGTYQLGLILTIPGGDPLNINDWHNGLLGLVDIRGLTITDEAVDFDEDGDGEVDDDADGDGFSDDDDDSDDDSDDSDSDSDDTGSSDT